MDFETHLNKYLDKNTIRLLLESIERRRSNFLVLNTNKISCEYFEELFPLVKKHHFLPNVYEYDDNIYSFGKMFYFDNGAYYIMDSSSLLVSFLLPVKDNDYVLDMCAAPGGKTISTLLKNPNINLLSNEISYKRSLILSSNLEKMGFPNVIISSNTIDILEKYYINTFDKIILDAPCSGSAMFRKNINMKNDWTYNKVISCQKEQMKILEQASKILKDNGIISYSTCSFSFEENEEVIIDFLNKHAEFELINLNIDKYKEYNFFHSKELPEAIHIFPHLFNGEGHFICLLHKKTSDKIDTLKYKIKSKLSNDSEFKYVEKINNFTYGYNNDLDVKNLTIIRKGVIINEYKNKTIIPSFNYSHYKNSKDSIKLNKDEAIKYLNGEELHKNLNLKKGYYIVSYNNLNLGYIHFVDNKLKNLYPKGLRRKFSI
ncbi:MAG: methyltransferase RsmF C-terminal domain-like protein [Bacillales bacterium]